MPPDSNLWKLHTANDVRTPPEPTTSGRVKPDGKHFSLDGKRFDFRGVTYGTFRPRPHDGARFPPTATIFDDFAAMRAAGFTVVRTYTEPTDDLLEAAAHHGLHLLAGIFYPDWRYML